MNRNISIRSTYMALFILLLGILVSLQLGYSAFYGLLIGTIVVYIVALRHGYLHKDILFMMYTGIKSAWIVLLMMAIIGSLIGVWMKGGTIPTMMYLGFRYLSRVNFILASFLITTIISMVLGTSLGSISTIGMALLGIGRGLNVPIPLLAGAIISGAYVGDRSSPMSSSMNLTCVITETKLTDNLKHMMTTMSPVFILCTLFYFWTGRAYIPDSTTNSQIAALQQILLSYFYISPIHLLSPFIIIVLAIFRIPIITSLGMGFFVSCIFILFTGHLTLKEILYSALLGFHPTNFYLSSILSGGGLLSMKNVILIIASSTALNGILDGTGMIAPLIQKFIQKIKSIGHLIMQTSFLSFIIAAITCNQTLSIIITGKFLQPTFSNYGVSKNTLARTLSDTGTVLVPLIPWNVNAIVIATIFRVSVWHFIPYSVLCYLLPIFTVFYGFMGWVQKDNNAHSSY
ncbi:Na+/H+ antiporter NhaC family protein [Clostridiaceae bacterium 35-E11]